MNVNEQAYWNDRFSTGDWEDHGGDEQSAYFSSLAIQYMPEWLKKNLNEEELSVRDYGCARGSGTALLAKNFPTSQFTGIDFSEDAIKHAKNSYAYCKFETGDLYTDELPECDVVFSSNTLEHLREPRKILQRIVQSARKHAIILLPLDDTTEHKEHFFKFSVDFFPEIIGDHLLAHFSIIDCRDGASPYWKDKQILLVYTHKDNVKYISGQLGEICRKSVFPPLDALLSCQNELAQARSDAEADHARLLEQIEQNVNELNQVRKDMERLLLDNQTLQEQKKGAEENVKRLEESFRTASDTYEAEIAHLHKGGQEQIESLNQAHAKVLEESVRTERNAAEERLRRQQEETQAVLERTEEEKQDLIKEISELKDAGEHLRQQQEEIQVALKQTREEKQCLMHKINELNSEKATAHEELSLAQQKMRKLTDEFGQLLVDTVTDKQAMMKKARSTEQKLRTESQQQIDQMTQLLANKSSEAEANQHEMIMLSQQMNQMRDRLEKAEKIARDNDAIITQLNARLAGVHSVVSETLNTGRALSSNRSSKFAHLLSRYRAQYQRGNKAERKAFRQWLWAHIKGKPVAWDTQYNPLYQLITPMEQIQNLSYGISGYVMDNQALPAAVSVQADAVPALTAQLSDEAVSPVQPRYTYVAPFLKEEYQKYDVIVFAVIDYDFRYQRPQQIADHFVREGHRVFYVNANFTKNNGLRMEQKGNLYTVRLSSMAHNAIYSLNAAEDVDEIYSQLETLMLEQGIRDAVMISDYPTWVSPVQMLKQKFGFNLVTDYMDDFTGFQATCEPFVKNDCIQLLHLSDMVVASSQYLVDAASLYNKNVFAIRNGTEYEHFHSVFGQKHNQKRKIIGYYGAIAEWFDFGKIEYLAKRFTDCDIVLIGDVTNEKVKACDLPNVKKLGEISYQKLPAYLADFDVCLIPFDTTTDLIKATNPVKFYEYLSAGKKIVATEIPELEPFRDQYVYLANDENKFADYVELCLHGRDTLACPEECCTFAAENDWSQRVQAFERVVNDSFPRVSIIVLCYNQLNYTIQCVQSILTQTAYPNYELILVDNNSTDNTATYLQSLENKDPRVKIVLNKTNRGFAGGNNDGIDVSTGEYIILLNNDTLVTRGWMTSMVKHCRNDAHVGIVGAVTNSIGNEAQIPVEYEDVEDMPAFAYGYTAAHMGETYMHDGVLAMFCVMFSRKLVETIGKLDENYGVGMFEDDDYSVAAERAGFNLILPEDVFIHHYGSVSFKKLEDETHRKLFEKNKAYFEQKWGKEWHMHHYRR